MADNVLSGTLSLYTTTTYSLRNYDDDGGGGCGDGIVAPVLKS